MKTGRPSNAIERNVHQKGRYIEPPAGLPVEQARLFRELVRDYPPTYYRQSDVPILTEFVRLRFELERLWAMVHAPDFEDTLPTDRGGDKINPIYTLLRTTEAAFQRYARLCRLAPSARASANNAPAAEVEDDDDDDDDKDTPLRSVV